MGSCLGLPPFEEAFAGLVMGRLGPVVCGALEDLLSRPNVLAGLKSDPGPLRLDTLLAGRDRQAGHRPVAGADRAGVRRDLGPDCGVVAGTGGPDVPLGLRRLPRPGARCWRHCAGRGRPSWSTDWWSC